jgi:AmiR/NasT family two-component response regulator
MGDAAETGPKRILVADDEHLMATGLATGLRSLDFTVVGPVSDGESACETCREADVDMALLDIRMPGMDGLTAAAQIWEERQIPSVIISAYSDDRYLARAQQIGVYGYLLKPVSTENLRVTISVAWSRAMAHSEQGKRVDQLQGLLANRRTIEQAKWILVQEKGMTEPDAHAYLQRMARDSRQRLVDVASTVLEEHGGAGKPPA